CQFTQPPPHGVRHGAADAGVDLIEDEHRRGTTIGQRYLEREQEPAQFAPRSDLAERSRRRAGVGLDVERDLVMAVRRHPTGIHLTLDDESGRSELEVRQFPVYGHLQLARQDLTTL